MKEQTDTFAERNFMVRVLFIEYSHGKQRTYAEAWLTQKHPYGYFIDYFDTLDSALKTKRIDDETRHERNGYKHEYVIYELKVV